MAKIVDEPVLLRHDMLNGKKIPVYSAKVETTITNTKTGQEYSSHEECEADIRRDVHVIAPQVFAGAETAE